MAFPSDGRNHRDGIKVEKSIYKYKEVFESHYNKKILKITHIGGTKTLIDFEIEFFDGSKITKSLKKKKTIKNGSFDYINCSDFDPKITKNSKDIHNKIKNKHYFTREDLNKSISDDLLNLNSEDLTKFVIDKVINKYKKIGGLDIFETSTNNLYIDIKPYFFEVLENGGYLKVKNNKKINQSYMLDLFDKNDILQEDCGLRIRLHLNNGWTKLKNGGYSVLVLKLQQDKVDKILKK
jgi:hypothetical protein